MTVWPLVPLGDLAAPVRHACVGGPFGSELTSKDYVAAPGVPIIRGGNLGEYGVFKDESFVFVSDEKAESLRANQAVPGDVVFTQRGTIGQVAAIPKAARFAKYVISQSQMKLTPDPDRVESRYLVHYFLSPAALRFLAENTLATGVPHINLSILKRIPVPLPPLAEQRRIADILDKADAIRRKRKEAIALSEELLRSAFLEMFGDPVTNPKRWPLKRMGGEIIQRFEAGTSVNGEPRLCRPGELGVLKISAVTSGVFRPEEHKTVEFSVVPSVPVVPQRGDLLFSRANTRELVAATCLVEVTQPNLFLPDKLWRVVPASSVTSEYLRYLFGHPKFRGELTKRATGTSGSMLNVSMEKVNALDAPVPPKARQEDFSCLVWKTYALRDKLTAAHAEAESLFASLLHRAFRGERTAPAPKSTTPHKKQLSFLE